MGRVLELALSNLDLKMQVNITMRYNIDTRMTTMKRMNNPKFL